LSTVQDATDRGVSLAGDGLELLEVRLEEVRLDLEQPGQAEIGDVERKLDPVRLDQVADLYEDVLVDA